MVNYDLTVGRRPAFGLQHIHVDSDSTAFGFGSTSPKYRNSWPGVLRATLDAEFGSAGSGIVLLNNDLLPSDLSWDGRISVAGTVTEQTLGWYRRAAWEFADGSGNYFQFADTVTEVEVTLLAKGSGIGGYSIDGGAAGTFRLMATGGVTPNIEKQPGYHSGLIVARFPMGTLGAHSLRIWGTGTTMTPLTVRGIRPLARGYEVSNESISGQAMGALITSDETNATYGLPLLDTALLQGGQGIVILALETNEWTGGNPSMATVKSRLATGIARVKTNPNYRVVVMLPPQPNPTLQAGSFSYTTLAGWIADQCATDGVEFWNLQKLWAASPSDTDEAAIFASGNAQGMYFDQIHPSDKGSISIAGEIRLKAGV